MYKSIKSSFQSLVNQGFKSNLEHTRTWLRRLLGLGLFTAVALLSVAIILICRSGYFISTKSSDKYLLTIWCISMLIFVGLYYLLQRMMNHILICMENYQALEDLKQQQVEKSMRNLSELNVQLKQTNVELETFAYSVSHDLKEPMRMVSAYTKILEKKVTPLLDNDAILYFGFVKDGVLRLQRLLEGILDFSRLGNVKEKMVPIDIEDVMYYVQKNLKISIENAQAQIKIIGKLPTIMGRYSEMVQLFQNLLSNSIKFRENDVTPVINISSTSQDGFHTITIQDNGIGIETAFHEKIFEPFERLHSRTQYEGSGIGLAICKKIVEQYKGRIWFESEVGNGTTFYVRFPENEQVSLEEMEKEIQQESEGSRL